MELIVIKVFFQEKYIIQKNKGFDFKIKVFVFLNNIITNY